MADHRRIVMLVKTQLSIDVVDDDSSVCKALSRLLRTSQMQVRTHGSGDEFLRSLELHEPDCLILDIRMPAMTGPELRQRLLEDGHDIPIVFITAHAEDEVTERNVRAAGIEILRKPFDNQVLLDAIERAVERHKPL